MSDTPSVKERIARLVRDQSRGQCEVVAYHKVYAVTWAGSLSIADAILDLIAAAPSLGVDGTASQGCGDGQRAPAACHPDGSAIAAEAVSSWRPIETASEHDVAYKALGIALAALQHIQGMEPITQEITLPTVMAQHAVDALKEIEALGATSCPNPCGECRGVVRAGKCGVCGWEPVP